MKNPPLELFLRPCGGPDRYGAARAGLWSRKAGRSGGVEVGTTPSRPSRSVLCRLPHSGVRTRMAAQGDGGPPLPEPSPRCSVCTARRRGGSVVIRVGGAWITFTPAITSTPPRPSNLVLRSATLSLKGEREDRWIWRSRCHRRGFPRLLLWERAPNDAEAGRGRVSCTVRALHRDGGSGRWADVGGAIAVGARKPRSRASLVEKLRPKG